MNDHELAVKLATDAGELLVELRAALFGQGAHSWQVMDHGDISSHRFLMSELRTHRPEDAVLSEEGADDKRRLTADRVWIVDPLDGTNEYGERNRSDWAVHVALWERGKGLTAGAVSLPAVGRTFGTSPAATLVPPEYDSPRLVTSRHRAPYGAVVAGRALGMDAIRLGSAGAKAMAVVMGLADLYLHEGGMYQWDSAAPAAVCAAAGLHVCRVDGSPMEYNARDAWLPDFMVCRPHLVDDVLTALWGQPTGRFG